MHASPLVVFIHGINYWHVHFNKMATYLHEELGYATLQYDNLGMGFTSLHPSESRRDETWKGKGHVQQLYDLLRELNMLRPPLFLIGHSMGACIATLFASEHPECVAGLVLLAPSGLMKLKRFSGIWALRTFVRHVPPLSDYFKQKVGKNKTRVHAKALEKSGDFVNAESEEARNTALQIARQHIHNVNAWTAFWKCLCLFPLLTSFYSLGSLIRPRRPKKIIATGSPFSLRILASRIPSSKVVRTPSSLRGLQPSIH